MCNIYTNEHYWVIGSNTSRVSAPYVGQPCQCGAVRWGSAQQSFAPDGLTPRQKEEVEQMIASAIIKASS